MVALGFGRGSFAGVAVLRGREPGIATVALAALSLLSLPPLFGASTPKTPLKAPPSQTLQLRKEDFSPAALQSLGRGARIEKNGAAWLGQTLPFKSEVRTRFVPTPGNASIHRYGYFGLDTYIRRENRIYRVNSDIGLSVCDKGIALPFALTRDPTLRFEKATVRVLIFNDAGEVTARHEGKLNGSRPYLSFKTENALRPLVEFGTDEQVTLSLSMPDRHTLLFTLQSAKRKVSMTVPTQGSSSVVSRKVHLVASATSPKAQRQSPATYLSAAATLLPPDELERFPAMEKHFTQTRVAKAD